MLTVRYAVKFQQPRSKCRDNQEPSIKQLPLQECNSANLDRALFCSHEVSQNIITEEMVTQECNGADTDMALFCSYEMNLRTIIDHTVTQECNGANLDVALAQHLLVAADKFQLLRLRRICERRLCETVEVRLAFCLVLIPSGAENHHSL